MYLRPHFGLYITLDYRTALWSLRCGFILRSIALPFLSLENNCNWIFWIYVCIILSAWRLLLTFNMILVNLPPRVKQLNFRNKRPNIFGTPFIYMKVLIGYYPKNRLAGPKHLMFRAQLPSFWIVLSIQNYISELYSAQLYSPEQ